MNIALDGLCPARKKLLPALFTKFKTLKLAQCLAHKVDLKYFCHIKWLPWKHVGQGGGGGEGLPCSCHLATEVF